MKSLRTIFKYIARYPKLVAAYFSFNILSALFSVISLGLLSPFLLLIFKKENTFKAVNAPANTFSGLNPINYFKQWLYEIIQSPGGEIKALAFICVVVLISIILKNIFLYLSMYYLNP